LIFFRYLLKITDIILKQKRFPSRSKTIRTEISNYELYALYRKIRNLAIPIDVQLKLFDSLITPIFVYSCEVWGFENKQGIEKMHLYESI
jgi:hypothetical protein